MLGAIGANHLACNNLEVALRPTMAAAHITTVKSDNHRWSGSIGFKHLRAGRGEFCHSRPDAHGTVPDGTGVHSTANREKFGQQICRPGEWR
jgi:hypothetical protein